MKHLWIINHYSSITLFYHAYSDLTIDPVMASSLLTAMNQFSEIELQSAGISSIDMAGLRWIYLIFPEFKLMLVAASDLESNAFLIRARLNIIHKMFVAKYNITIKAMQKDIQKIDIYNDFADTVMMLHDQWNQAEMMKETANLFDMIRLFQEIFNILGDIIKTRTTLEQKQQILKEVGEFAEGFRDLPEIQQNPYLQKIAFDPTDSAWDVMELNAVFLDEFDLKQVLFTISNEMKSIFFSVLGHEGSFILAQDLMPFFISQYELLESLKINKTILTIFGIAPNIA
jgi:hypothetical protein